MTCIVGIVDSIKKEVIIASDSIGSNDNAIKHRKDKKVFKLDEFIIGATTSYRMIQLMQFSFSPPPIEKQDPYEYLCTKFTNALIQCFEDNLYSRNYDGQIEGGEFLIGYKDRLFHVYSDFSVSECQTPYDACGAGEEYALGYIWTNKSPSPKDVLVHAINAASFLCPSVGGNIHIMSTAGTNAIIIKLSGSQIQIPGL